MDTSNKMKQQISQALDADLSEMELNDLLQELRNVDRVSIVQTWDEYHMIGDVLRSDELDVQLSSNFASKLMARLDGEPTIIAPNKPNRLEENPRGSSVFAMNSSRYMAMTSMAAAVMVAFIMAPQIISSFQSHAGSPVIASKNDGNDSFNANVRLASNSNKELSSSENSVVRVDPTLQATAKSQAAKEVEFSQKLENQVEMLRDPRLDSYLQAHQKVSPTFETGARHIQRANVVSEQSEK